MRVFLDKQPDDTFQYVAQTYIGKELQTQYLNADGMWIFHLYNFESMDAASEATRKCQPPVFIDFRRLRRILTTFLWKTDVLYPYWHPQIPTMPKSILIRYDGSPQIKLAHVEKDTFHVIQVYHNDWFHFDLYKIHQGAIVSYDRLCRCLEAASRAERYLRSGGLEHGRALPVPEQYIVKQ